MLGAKVERLVLENAMLGAKVESLSTALTRVMAAVTSMCITDAAKKLRRKPSDLFRILEHKLRWIHKRGQRTGPWIPTETGTNGGYVEWSCSPKKDKPNETRVANPIAIQLSRAKGWRMPPSTIKIDRSGPWGNPILIGAPPCEWLLDTWCWTLPAGFVVPDTAEQAAAIFIGLLARDTAAQAVVQAFLGGYNLGCWCSLDACCHRAVLLRVAAGGAP
jgi:Domain of unknown function (DUF4326)